ncbi:hypothetical protein LCGC14_2653920, partial [marine sediment metagenome]
MKAIATLAALLAMVSAAAGEAKVPPGLYEKLRPPAARGKIDALVFA